MWNYGFIIPFLYIFLRIFNTNILNYLKVNDKINYNIIGDNNFNSVDQLKELLKTLNKLEE